MPLLQRSTSKNTPIYHVFWWWTQRKKIVIQSLEIQQMKQPSLTMVVPKRKQGVGINLEHCNLSVTEERSF